MQEAAFLKIEAMHDQFVVLSYIVVVTVVVVLLLPLPLLFLPLPRPQRPTLPHTRHFLGPLSRNAGVQPTVISLLFILLVHC